MKIPKTQRYTKNTAAPIASKFERNRCDSRDSRQPLLRCIAVALLLTFALPLSANSADQPIGSPAAMSTPHVQAPGTGAAGSPMPTPQSIVLKITPDRILEMYTSVNSDEAWLKLMGIFLPILIIVVSVMAPTMAKNYIETQISAAQRELHSELDGHNRDMLDRVDRAQHNLQSELQRDLERAIQEARTALEKATLDSQTTRDELKSTTEKVLADLERKLLIERATVSHSVAFLFWQNKDSEAAAEYAGRALKAVDGVLTAVTDSKANGVEASSTNQASVPEERRLEYLEFRCTVKADLAYYLAVSFVTTKKPEYGERSLSAARGLTEDWKVYGDIPPISLVDNFIFVISRVATATQDEKVLAEAIYRNRQQELEVHLASHAEILKSYADFFGPACSK